MHDWSNLYFYEEGNIRYIGYRSNMTVYQERMANGKYEAVGWRGNGTIAESTTTFGSPRLNPDDYLKPAAFSLDVDGVCLDGTYDWMDCTQTDENEGRHIRIHLKSRTKPVNVTIHTVLDGTGILTRWLTVENTGSGSITLSRLVVMGGALTVRKMISRCQSPYEVGYMHDAETHHEGDFHWMSLPRNTFSFGTQHVGERYRHPFFVLRDKTSADLFIAQLGFNGGYRYSFHNRVDAFNGTAFLSFEAEAVSRPPLYVLSPGEQMDSPAMHMGIVQGGLHAGIQEMTRHTRRYCGAYEKHSFVEGTIGPDTDMSEEMVMNAIDNAAEVGAELFWIDASWYSPEEHGEKDWPAYCGDWEPVKWRYQRSMKEIGDYVRSKKMCFGLWCDIEKLGHASKALRNPSISKLHQYDEVITPDAQCATLDLSAPEGVQWAYEQISGLIKRHSLDFFRLDSGAHSFTSGSMKDGVMENRDLRYHANLCALFERLRQEFPHVVFQNCAGGGQRLGLDLMRTMSDTQISDCTSAPQIFSIFNGVSMFLPPEYLFVFVHPCTDQRSETIDFVLNLAQFGHPACGYTLPCGIEYNPIFREKIRKMVETYQTFIRPMQSGSRMFHHTPDLDMEKPGCRGILEMASENSDCAVLGVFTLSEVLDPNCKVVFKGLSAAMKYEVYVNSLYYCRMSGKELLKAGLSVELPVPLDSKLIIAKAV